MIDVNTIEPNGVITVKNGISDNKTEIFIENTMRDKMLRGLVASTLTVRLVRTIEIVSVAKSAGYDGLFIDMEHSTLDLDTTGQLCQAALLAGITPIVRSPTKEPFFVSRILDGGAQGVVVSNRFLSKYSEPLN